MKPKMTYTMAMAAGQDAGNRSMRKAGRTRWNWKDRAEAVRTFNRLWKMLILLALCASPAFAQLQKQSVQEITVQPFERTVLTQLIAPADGVYMVSANVWLIGGWYGYPIVLEVQSSAIGNLYVCGSTAPFGSYGPGPIPAGASCGGLVALKSGDQVWAAVYHESGSGVTVDGQRSTFSLVRLVTATTRMRAQTE